MFKVYSSSAGSGKTYTLTKEYLKLALSTESETYFRSILAVTFTNAAANEMKERILSMLRVFSTAEGAAHPMLRDIITELYPDIEHDPILFSEACELYGVRAEKLFRKILHRYSDFSVMTIDKFTQRLVSCFTDELGIPFGFETQVDSDQLSHAIDRMLARIGQEDEAALTGVVETYYRESAQDGKSWGSLPLRIRDAAQDLLNEKSYLSMQKVADLDISDWVDISRQIKAFINETEYNIISQAQKALKVIEDMNLVQADFARGGQGIHAYFEKRARGEDLWKAGNSYVLAAINEDKWCAGKTPASIQEDIKSIASVLIGSYREIENIQTQYAAKARVLSQIDRHLYNLSLLGEIRKEFDTLLRQGNQVHISDFNRKVLDIVTKEPVPFIYERLGDKYNHILIDEFQDTSKLQFANLLPLIDNALGFGHFNLIVGDAKQSIYRFRGGDMDLILHLSRNQIAQLATLAGDNAFTTDRLLGVNNYLQVAHLKTNRRSYHEVTEFNNGFFRAVADSLLADHSQVGSVFDENFQQLIPDNVKKQGHVQIEFLSDKAQESESEEGESNEGEMVARTLEIVGELREQGYFWRDIAILCRKKKEATAIASALKDRGYPLISDDSLLLTYAQSVNLLVAFMKVLQAPDHALVRYEAAHLFHRVVLGVMPTAEQHESIRIMCAERDTASFFQYFVAFGVEFSAFRMRQLGVYELCEKLITTLRLYDGLAEAAYLFRFMDAILEFGTRRSNHLADFLTYWDSARHKISITVPAHTDALRITTIHKSKGLEYPVVIVPNCNWKFLPDATRDRMWVDLESVQEPELVLEKMRNEEEKVLRRLNSTVVSMVKDLEDTSLSEEIKDERTRTALENLNLLYVAFTRPIQRLYVLAKDCSDWSRNNNSVNKWLYEYLNSDAGPVSWEESKRSYVLWKGEGDCCHNHSKEVAVPYPLHQVISTDRTDRLRLRRLAERIFDVETFEKKKDHWQKMRYTLSQLQSTDELLTVIRKLTKEGVLDSEETRRIQNSLQRLLSNPEIAPLFNPRNQTRLNREFLIPGGKVLTVDRLITLPDGHTVLMNIVAGTGSDGARRQLRKMGQIYRDMGHSSSKVVLVTLENGALEWID